MRRNCSLVGLALLLLTASGICQEQPCPGYSDRPALLRFLHDHRSNSREADPECVRRAFASLSEDKAYIRALVGLLDFERNYDHDEKLISRTSQYPAIGALAHQGAIPSLVKAVEESDSELVRINAADAIDLYETCAQATISLLEKEATKPETFSEEQYRIRQAEGYIREHSVYHTCNGKARTKGED